MIHMRVGFIGLGIMGQPMATNILKVGFPLVVYNRTRSKAEALRSMGASVAESPMDVARRSDVVILMVTDAPDVEELLFSEHGVVKGAHDGLVVIDMSTNSPDHAKHFADTLSKHGIEFLDAPVTGGDKGAREGTLTIMVGGKYEVFVKVKPVLEAMGKTIIYVGNVGSGQMMKLLNQIVVALNTLALSEAVALARRVGINEELLYRVLTSGAADSAIIRYYMPKLMNNDMRPGFKAAHLRKDLKYALDVGNKYSVPLFGTALTLQLYNELVSRGLGEEGIHALVKLLGERVDI